jgi:tetratricopeptide (TPR) repeat protein
MRFAVLTVALGVLWASSGCGQRSPAGSSGAGGSGGAAAQAATAGATLEGAGAAGGPGARRAGAAAAVPQQLTPGEIALGNLDDHIQVLERQLEAPGARLELRAQLVDALLSRAQCKSSFSDFQRAEELAEPAPERSPREPRALLLRARFRMAVHRFADAESDLASAEALGASRQETELRRASLHIAQGRELPAALEVAARRASAHPLLERLSLQALAEAALGRFDAADEHYQAALASYRDVTPFPVAAIEFQRGVMWAELAHQPERALPHYLEAVQVLPQYVVANVHLAEIELERGESAAAEQRLRKLARQDEDPEPWARLAELLLARAPGDAEGHALIERAGRRYELLLRNQRAAFLDHAAEFFLGAGGNAARAAELARANLELRQTGRAYELALESAAAAGDVSGFCEYARRAADAATRSRNLSVLLASNAARCGAPNAVRH